MSLTMLAFAVWLGIGLAAAVRYLVWSKENAAFIALFVSLGPVSAAVAKFS